MEWSSPNLLAIERAGQDGLGLVARAGAAGAPGLRDGQDRLTSAGGESSGLVSQEGAFDESADAGAFVRVELVEGGEVDA